jgi:hypothetical protein
MQNGVVKTGSNCPALSAGPTGRKLNTCIPLATLKKNNKVTSFLPQSLNITTKGNGNNSMLVKDIIN